MGAGFYVQIVNATASMLTGTLGNVYQMVWEPPAQIASNDYVYFYGEFEDNAFSINDEAFVTYKGQNGLEFEIYAKKKGIDGVTDANPPPDVGYGVLVTWRNIPPGMVVYPPPDTNSQSSIGWIHDGMVTIGIGYFRELPQQQMISPYPTPNYGGGTIDGDKSALKPSVKHWAKNWMELYQPYIQNLTLGELTLPGTHDAGTPAATGVSQRLVQTQYLSLQQQLEQGIRAFDIRLLVDTGKCPAGNQRCDERFQFQHGRIQANLSFVRGVQQIQNFLAETSKEIVILDFHKFENDFGFGKDWTDDDFKDLARLIESSFGGYSFDNGQLIPRTSFGPVSGNLGSILSTSGRIVVGMGQYSEGLPDHILTWLRQNTAFWTDAVQQFWSGKSYTTWDFVASYMDGVQRELAPPRNNLWAFMAQYNYLALSTLVGVPTNIPIEISRYFYGGNGLRANIIHTDWWNRISDLFRDTNFPEKDIPNFSALIGAVPLNLMKGFRRANAQSPFCGTTNAPACPSFRLPVNTHDYNSDGKSDIAWRDGGGNLALWLMNGGTASSSGGVGGVSATWSIVGQRDFDGDGQTDLLWRDTGGNTAIWFLSGTQVASTGSVGNIPATWSVAATADFNGDGLGDILWQDGSGNLAVWLMNGTSVSSSGELGNVPTAWTVVGTGDFDGDGKADLLWRDAIGNTSIWFMNGTQVSSPAGVGNVPTAWSAVGTGDFNSDGKSDILWRDNSGNTAIWLMNGASVSSSAGLGNIQTTWSVAGTGDYNGDRYSDILWRDSSGNTSMWFMNGTIVSSTADVGNIPTTWSVQSANAE